MNEVLLLVGLLVLSYLGSVVAAGFSAGESRSKGSIELVVVGFAVGPQALGLVDKSMLDAFDPIVQVAIGWLAFAVGLDFGHGGGKRIRAGGLVLGALGALFTGTAVAAAVWTVARRVNFHGTSTDRLLLAGGIGAACAQTARYSVGRTAGIPRAGDTLSERLDTVVQADQLFPLLAVAILFALEPTTSVAMPAPLLDWPAITIALGMLLGAGGALRMRSDLPEEDTWAVLFGVSLIGIGTSARLGLSTLTASFCMGIAVSLLSPDRYKLRQMVAPTERPVLLPAMLIAGARLDFHATPALPWIVSAAVVARILAKVAFGGVLASAWNPARAAGALVGLSLLPPGVLAMSMGLAFALRFPGPVGNTVLVATAVAATVGEFADPGRFRRLFQTGAGGEPVSRGAAA
jgi:hypothetical protein